ncbi:serine/threonine-protein kinase [Chondromyces crocatus]|uniref:Protein kinase domain-containing protein n=1 Tax=Chondromyces crocatus TaxID=52 RepID=A0A0K1E7U3_CHOCO|nr:serine/threonine-protein kinase [Chondromyces crocatus]AKT36935.1 uncharacterized protein CMC5_010560 [Chondromyces crocatus]
MIAPSDPLRPPPSTSPASGGAKPQSPRPQRVSATEITLSSPPPSTRRNVPPSSTRRGAPHSTRYVHLHERRGTRLEARHIPVSEALADASTEPDLFAAIATRISEPPTQLAPGHLLAGRYQMLERLGEGGMGIVWRARSLGLDVEVAVKVIHPAARIPNARERLLREARVAARVVHPAAARVLDFGVAEEEIPFLVMEHIRGGSLGAALREGGPLGPTAAVKLLLPVLGALDEAHRLGIVHRDVKPGNILLAEGRGRLTPKLIDFGIAALAPSPWASKLAFYPPLYGTPRMMAPEQARGGADADPRVDIWGFCFVLHQALGGVPADTGRRDAEPERLGRPAALATEPELWAILARGLELSPAARWATAQALGASLARWALVRGITADSAGTALTEAWLDG